MIWVYRYNNKEGEETTIGFRLRNQYKTMDMPTLSRALGITLPTDGRFPPKQNDTNTFDFFGIITGGVGKGDGDTSFLFVIDPLK